MEIALWWLNASAEQGNQYAQYAFGKLYLIGKDVEQDKAKAFECFTLSAAQGNEYAQFFIDHMNDFGEPSVMLCTTRLLHHLSNVFQDKALPQADPHGMQIDRKQHRKTQEKKVAQGHAQDDYVQEQKMWYGGYILASYIYFSEEQKLRAASVDLVEFLLWRGENLIRSGNDRRLANDKSITVRGNGWYDHSAERGGNAISFVREFYGYNYPDAVSLLLGGEQGETYKSAEKKQSPQERKPFVLPDANSDMRRVYAYLLKQRFIDRDVLTHFAREKTIFEDEEYHNAVFVGCDENGVPRHAHKKSSTTFGDNFRINVEGCDPAYSFHHVGTSNKLYVFEAPVDMLSFISLYQKDWQQHSYVSLCGVSEHAMLKMLELHPHLQNVVLCLDHDEAGIESTERLVLEYKCGHEKLNNL